MSIQRPWLLAADMDGTVIPLRDTPEQRRDIRRFRKVLESRNDVLLAYVTGRDLNLAERGIQEFELPLPDLLATDVGTALHRWDGDAFRPDPEYTELMRQAMGGFATGQILSLLESDPALTLQEKERQGTHKISFYVDPAVREMDLLPRLRLRLEQCGAQMSLVYSRDELAGVGLLDVLPRGVAKDAAVRFLHDHTGVEESRLVYAGDSGNDKAAMLAGYRVVVVGNAPETLREDLQSEARALGRLDHLYFASAPYVGGVLEGMAHWGVLG
jgi:sucrose-6F-phosphate phosphohydrolase